MKTSITIRLARTFMIIALIIVSSLGSVSKAHHIRPRPQQPGNRPSIIRPFLATSNGNMPYVTCGYNCGYHNDGFYHELYAVDFAANDHLSFPILAAAGGDVSWHYEPGATGGNAKVAVVDHGNGWFSKYAHMDNITVRGQTLPEGISVRVRQGERIGDSGSTGATAIHLHFELRATVSQETWTFPVDEILNWQGTIPPMQPDHVSPLNGSNVASGNRQVTITWSHYGDPDNGPRPNLDSYPRVWKADNPSQVMTPQWIFNTSWTFTAPSAGTYCWNVMDGDGGAASLPSDAWCFNLITNSPPNQPILRSPTNGSTTTLLNVTLTVDDGGDPDSSFRDFEFVYWRANKPNERTYRPWSTSKTWPILLDNYGTYCWQAQAGDGVTPSGWSTAWCFTIRPPETDCLKPLHRYWSEQYQQHFYTNNWEEIRDGNQYWNYEGIIGYTAVSASCHMPNSVALFRLRKGDYDHLYTVSTVERNILLGQGWIDEQDVGYVSMTDSSTHRTVAMYRLNKTSTEDHFYTTNRAEADAAVANNNYVDEGRHAYLFLMAGSPFDPAEVRYKVYLSRVRK